MGSWGNGLDTSLEEIPGTGVNEEDSLLNKARRFSQLSALEDPEEPPEDSRVDDEKRSASGGPSGPDAMAASTNPSDPGAVASGLADPGPVNPIQRNAGSVDVDGVSADERTHLSDLVAQRQALLNPAPKPSLKQRILGSLIKAAPIGIAAAATHGNMAAVTGASQAVEGQEARERADRIRQGQVRNQQAQTLGQQIETERGRQENNAFSASQGTQARNNSQLLAKMNQDAADKRLAATNAEKEKLADHMSDRDDSRAEASDKRQAATLKTRVDEDALSRAAQDKRAAQESADRRRGQDMEQGRFKEGLKLKEEAITPAAQKTIQETEPVKQQIDEILDRLEPVKDDNTPFTSTMGRLKYKMGMGSPEDKAAGDLDDMMGKISMSGIVGAARILKGSSRAYQVFSQAQDHLPDPWTDSKKKMYEQLTSVRQNIQDIEDDARKFGSKSGITPPTTGPRSPQGGGGARQAAGASAGGFGAVPQGIEEGRTATTKSGRKVVVKGGQWVPAQQP